MPNQGRTRTFTTWASYLQVAGIGAKPASKVEVPALLKPRFDGQFVPLCADADPLPYQLQGRSGRPGRFRPRHDDFYFHPQEFVTTERQRMELACAIKNQSTTLQEPVVFLPFHAMHYDQPLVATLCCISHAFAVRAENESGLDRKSVV